MPVIVEAHSSIRNGSHTDSPRAELRDSLDAKGGAQAESFVTVGLVNNMGEGAFRDTERLVSPAGHKSNIRKSGGRFPQ